MKKLILLALAVAAGLSYYNYRYVVRRCALEWVEYAPDVSDEPVVVARVQECPDFPGARLYLKRVGRKQYVVYLEDAYGKKGREIPLDRPAAIGNFIRGAQLVEINFLGYAVTWSNTGQLATDQDRVTKIPLKKLQ